MWFITLAHRSKGNPKFRVELDLEVKQQTNIIRNWRVWLAIFFFHLVVILVHGGLGYQSAIDVAEGIAFDWREAKLLVLLYLPLMIAGPFIMSLASVFKYDNGRWPKFLLLHLLVMFPFIFSVQIYAAYVIDQFYKTVYWQGSLLEVLTTYYKNFQWQMDYIYYLAFISIGFAFNYYWQIQQKEQEKVALTKQLVESQLNALKSQLNPHFLFNTLNTAVGLIRIDEKGKAISALTELSSMLRSILQNTNTQFVPLGEELSMIDSYFNIQKLRFADKLALTTEIDSNLIMLKIPFLLLQPILENAVKHGAQNNGEMNNVHLSIKSKDSTLCIEVVNDVDISDQDEGFGMGLSFLRQTLTQLYGKQAVLQERRQVEGNNNKFIIDIKIPMEADT